MSPNLETCITGEEIPEDNISIILSPLTTTNAFLPDVNLINDIHTAFNQEQDLGINDDINYVPLEQNLRELLVRVTDTEDLSTVTQLKLRVISRELTLQYLHIYMPALRELNLDCSAVASLRDIGNGLKNLKILKVNRCGLTCIDGVFGFENLEELYAADNEITSLAQCAFLSNLKILDVRRNFLKASDLDYLSLCILLEELRFEGNPIITNYSVCSKRLQALLSRLKLVDGVIISRDSGQTTNGSDSPEHESEPYTRNRNGNDRAFTGFSVNFPPRVCF